MKPTVWISELFCTFETLVRKKQESKEGSIAETCHRWCIHSLTSELDFSGIDFQLQKICSLNWMPSFKGKCPATRKSTLIWISKNWGGLRLRNFSLPQQNCSVKLYNYFQRSKHWMKPTFIRHLRFHSVRNDHSLGKIIWKFWISR